MTIGDGLLKRDANHAQDGSVSLYFPEKITGFWTIVVASLETASPHASAAKTAKFVPHAVGAEDCACTQELTMILGKNLVKYL